MAVKETLGGVRVPAIINYPSKLPQGAKRDQIITAMDWFPTVLDLCGIKQKADSPKLDGHNIVPIIKDKKKNQITLGFISHGATSGQSVKENGN